MKAAFNEDELRVIGKHTQFGIYGGEDTEAVSYNYPITPKENMLRMLRGEKPLWVPNQTLENNALQPLVMDDARARNFGGKDWFGIEWEYEPLTRAAMVKPGTRRLDDITNWRSLEFPDLRAIDWKKDYKERYEGKISQDRLTYFIIVNGFFERTADLTSFEDAFCYLLEEPEALTEFYDRLAEWHIELIKIAKEYYHTDMILSEGVSNLYICAKVRKDSHYAEVTIVDQHTNITRIVKDGQVLFSGETTEKKQEEPPVDKSKLTVKDILDFADQVKIEDVRELLERQIRLNTAISQEGLDNNYGAQIGKTLMHVWGKGITTKACARAAAGSDARMGGCSMPVVINSGSGNQGMTVSLPVITYAEEWEVSRAKLYRSLVVSNLVAIHQKYYIGSLSAYCGAVSAACGAGAGITYMYGGTYQQVSLTIINTLGNVGGIVCDGAKPSCAAKIASSVDAALMAFHMSIQNKSFLPGEGIIRGDVEETIKSMGYIGRVGMKATDTEILNIMIDRVNVDQDC